MKTMHFRQKTGANGALRLEVPVGIANAECEVVVIVEPGAGAADWLPGFWDRLSQGWQGEPLQRPEQGVCETREPLNDLLVGHQCLD